MKLRVGVIFGGASVEHEVSVISALQAIQNMNREQYDIVPIYISKEKVWYCGSYLESIEHYQDMSTLFSKVTSVTLCQIDQEFCLVSTKGLFRKVVDKIDVAFPIVHGQNVEDGTLVGFLETIGIPYVGSGVLGSSIGQDKVLMKQVFESCHIPVVDYVWFYDFQFFMEEAKYLKEIQKIGYPVVVKPAHLGSSVGICYVANENDMKKALEESFLYDSKVIVEKAVSSLIEVNCSVLGTTEHQEVSVIEEVLSTNDILTFNDKYVGDSKSKGGSKGMVNASRIIPANISKSLSSLVEEYSKQVFQALNLSGLCRIDFLIDSQENQVYVNEPNIIPGSLAFYLWEPKGKSYSKLLEELITLAIKEYKNKSKKTTCFDTNILENFGGLKGFKNK